jgi:hypothetical protein
MRMKVVLFDDCHVDALAVGDSCIYRVFQEEVAVLWEYIP